MTGMKESRGYNFTEYVKCPKVSPIGARHRRTTYRQKRTKAHEKIILIIYEIPIAICIAMCYSFGVS